MGGVVGKAQDEPSPKSYAPETKLEAKMVEAMQRRALEGTSMKSFNSIILKFPKIDESFRKCKTIFQQFVSREAAPKFGTPERQKLIDEIHQHECNCWSLASQLQRRFEGVKTGGRRGMSKRGSESKC